MMHSLFAGKQTFGEETASEDGSDVATRPVNAAPPASQIAAAKPFQSEIGVFFCACHLPWQFTHFFGLSIHPVPTLYALRQDHFW